MIKASPSCVLLIDKPAGCTSFDVIRQLRRQTGVRKFGHAGTLDPAATGLLLIGVGSGTKSLTHLTKLDKEYEATIFIGAATTTSDREGEVIHSHDGTVADIGMEKITVTVASLVGEAELPVSAFSAIKKDGVPFYKRARAAARQGQVVSDVPKRLMRVYAAEVNEVLDTTWQGYSGVAVTVRFAVGSGTYIRSLAEEVGRQLGYPALLTALRRTAVGLYRVEDAVLPEQVQEAPAC